MKWQCGRFLINVDVPKIMGVVNMTPDSFSDGSDYSGSATEALKHAEALVKEGADILDIGGESSRPGAPYVSPEEEWQRVYPILREVSQWGMPISLDTRRHQVMQRALDENLVDAINDIEALQDDGALMLLQQASDIGICLMHMQGQPESMQQAPHYEDVCQEVRQFLAARIAACRHVGIDHGRLLLDPGIGFGKTTAHNLALLKNPQAWLPEDLPYLIGVSRKSMFGVICGIEQPKERDAMTMLASLEAWRRGAAVVRVHNVALMRQGLTLMQAYEVLPSKHPNTND